MANMFERVLELQRAGQEGVLVTVVDKEGSGPLPPGARMLVHADGHTVGTVGGGAIERIATHKALALLGAGTSALVTYLLGEHNEVLEGETTGMVCGGRVTLFYECLRSAPRLYVFGGGHVGQALARLLASLDYRITVVDERTGIEEALPGVDKIYVAGYDVALLDENVPSGGYFVIATPEHRHDYAVLRRVLTSNWAPRYVGVIASRTKATGFLQDLRQELGADFDLGALYMPIGVDTGGSSAAEIAVSIVAEMQAVRYGRSGLRHMRLEALQRVP